MKRCILLSVREQKDSNTGEDVLFATAYRLPARMKNGGLWYPKKDESTYTRCVKKNSNPEDYEYLSKLLPGCLVDVELGLNEFTEKTFVSSMKLVKGTNIFDEQILFV